MGAFFYTVVVGAVLIPELHSKTGNQQFHANN